MITFPLALQIFKKKIVSFIHDSNNIKHKNKQKRLTPHNEQFPQEKNSGSQ